MFRQEYDLSAAGGTVGTLDPERDLPGHLVVVAPHMDDELIGCGALLASLVDGTRASVVYVTDGSGSPQPAAPWHVIDRETLARTRRDEALAGLEAVGVPPANAHFLELPDGELRRLGGRLRQALVEILVDLAPQRVLIPFRMDRHPDHIAVHRAVVDLDNSRGFGAGIHEYFVYSEWKLLPGGDIRSWVQPGLLRSLVPSEEIRDRKRQALELHESQTTRHFDWQRRPNLTAVFLDRVAAAPEVFLDTSRAPVGAHIFRGGRLRIHMAHRLEPALKRAKDRIVALVRG